MKFYNRNIAIILLAIFLLILTSCSNETNRNFESPEVSCSGKAEMINTVKLFNDGDEQIFTWDGKEYCDLAYKIANFTSTFEIVEEDIETQIDLKKYVSLLMIN